MTVLAALLLPWAAVQASSPADTVAHFQAALIDSMKQGASLSCASRVDRLDAAVRADFDVPAIARHVLRRRWEGLSAPQREAFTAALHELVVSGYAGGFRRHSGESFLVGETEPGAGGTRMVHASLQAPGDVPVRFDYVLRASGDDWRIVNVIVDGISDLALRSAQYDSLFRAEGFDHLLKSLREQAAKSRAGC